MREILVSKRLPPPRFRYSQVVKAGPNYVCSGMLALDAASGKLIKGGPGAQTRKILANLQELMDEFGLSWDDLVSARIFTSEFDRFAEINEAWEAVFTADITPPARSAVGVSALPMKASVEIEFYFYRESGA